MTTNWTVQEDDALRAGFRIGTPTKEIANQNGRSEGAVCGRASLLGVTRDNIFDETDGNFCPFCGQGMFDGDECDCDGAKRDRKIKASIHEAKAAIDRIFGAENEKAGFEVVPDESIEMLKTCVEPLAYHKIHAVSFILSSGTKAKLTRGAKGVIKIERTETKKDSEEVEE